MPSAPVVRRRVDTYWSEVQGDVLDDTTRFLDAEGAVRSGKTTVALFKVLQSCLKYPGIHWLVSRWTTDAMETLLRPVWRQLCFQHLHQSEQLAWHGKEHYDEFPNAPKGQQFGSMVYFLGLKGADKQTMYAKFRGLTLAGIYVDQAEEMPFDVFVDMKSRLSQQGYPHQMIITPNPPAEDHWIAEEFPESNDVPDHKYIRLRIYDNAKHLDPSTIPSIERAYPQGHTKRRPLIEGLRGLNVSGKAVYGEVFQRDVHCREIEPYPHVDVIEVIDFGKHHPCMLWAQLTPYGGLNWLGGVMGQDLFLTDFLPIALNYRAQWFPDAASFSSCCDPAGTYDNSHGTPIRGLDILHEHQMYPRWRKDSNVPTVRRIAVETISDYLRRFDTRKQPAFGLDSRRWVVVSKHEPKPIPFALQAFEAGYVWDPNRRSVGSKSVKVPLQEGWFEHVMNCGEYAVLNFGRQYKSPEQVDREQVRQRQRSLAAQQRDVDEYDASRHAQRRAYGGRVRSRRGT